MAHPLYHARSSAKQFGGVETDYYHLHSFFDQTKMCVPGNVHRLVLHNDFGIELCKHIYGNTFQRVSDGVMISTENIAQQHITEDFGYIPTLSTCFQHHPLHHDSAWANFLPQEAQAQQLAQKLGGAPDDYSGIIAWFHRPGELLNDPRFFCLLGNSFGIFLAETYFGIGLKRESDAKVLPTRYIAEQLVMLVLHHIPTLSHFFLHMPTEAWMWTGARRLSREFAEENTRELAL